MDSHTLMMKWIPRRHTKGKVGRLINPVSSINFHHVQFEYRYMYRSHDQFCSSSKPARSPDKDMRMLKFEVNTDTAYLKLLEKVVGVQVTMLI